ARVRWGQHELVLAVEHAGHQEMTEPGESTPRIHRLYARSHRDGAAAGRRETHDESLADRGCSCDRGEERGPVGIGVEVRQHRPHLLRARLDLDARLEHTHRYLLGDYGVVATLSGITESTPSRSTSRSGHHRPAVSRGSAAVAASPFGTGTTRAG